MRKLRFLAVMLLSLFLWQSTEIMAAPTAASATVNGKTVNYSYEFTESAGDATSSVTSFANGGGISPSVERLVKPKSFDGNGKWFQNLGSTSTPSVNLALNKPVKSSSDENDGKKASYAVDGNTGTAWSSEWTDVASFQVDLITRKTFDKIVIQWETAYSKSFTIEAGNNVDSNGDLVDGTVIATVTDQTIDNANHYPQTISVTPITARYIRFNSSKRATEYGNSFYEFEVYADQCTTALDPTDVPAVKSVGTDGITAVRALYNQGTPGYGFAFASWSSENKTENTQETVAGKTIDLFNNFTFYGSNYTAFDATLWEKLHVDIYPMDGVSTVAIMPIKEDTGGKGQQFTVTPGQWNSLELDMATLAAAGLDRNGINQIMIGGSLDGGGGMVNASGNGALYVGNIYYYTTAILPPTTIPTIKTVGTDGITAVRALYDQGTKQNGFYFTAWGSHTDPTAATVDGKTISLFSNFSYLGGQYTGFDATQWDKLVIDIYPMTSMDGVQIFPINAGKTEYNQSFNPTVGQWNTLEVDLQTLNTSGLDITNLNQLKVNNASGAEFYVGNIYYYSTQNITYAAPTDVPDIITSFNDGTNTYTIESDQVTKIYTVAGNAPTNFNFDELYNHYGETSSRENVSINSKQAVKFVNFDTVIGKGFNEVSLSSANYLHVDIYPMSSFNVAVYPARNANGVQLTNLTPGQWNSIDIPMSSLNSPTSITDIMLTQNVSAAGTEDHSNDIKNVTLYLGNYYFFRTATVPDTQKPVMATATVSNIGTTTATLTVRATDNKAGTLTYNIYNGSTEGTLLATATGAPGQNTVVNLTGLTQGGTYNLVVTATDAASNTSASMAVAFTTLNYIPTLTTIYVRMKGESTDAYNVAKTEPGMAQCTIQIIALDQKGNDMPTRQMGLRIVDGNTGTNDVKLVETANVRTVPKSSEEGSTSIQKFNHVGRVTIEAVDNLTGKTGFGFLTFYDAANTAETNEDQLISNPAQVASAKITGANESIIRLAADGHGTANYVTDGTQPAEFVVDWSSIQDNQQHYEYYDIDMIQVLYQQGKFPSDYTIAVSHDGGNTYEDVYRYDGKQEFYNPSSNPGFRADAWNASRQLTQAVTHVRFRSNNNDAIAFDAFKVYGKLNSVDDNKAPYDLYAGVKVAASTDDANKTSTAQIWIECKDDETAESDYLYYTITSARGMQYTTKGHPRKGENLNQVIFDFNNTLVPGSHYVFYITASDGRNKTDKKGSSAELMKIEFDTPALASAPDVDGAVASKASTTATLNYWLPVATNTAVGDDDDIVITVKRGTTVVADATYKKGQVDENNKVALNLERLTPSTTYTYTITATNTVNGLSSEKSLTFATEAGGSSLEVWFTDGGEHYTGWTGQLEDIITTKGNRNVLGVTEIHIKGSLNNEDIMLLRRMAGGATYIGNNSVKQRVFIKADAAPYLYAWKGAEELLGNFPGRQLTTKTNGGYYVFEFNTDGVSIVINNGKQEGSGNTNNQTENIPLALGNNYFTYDGGNGYEDKTETGYYGTLATMDLAQAEFYHDGGSYVIRWYDNANTPTILNPIDGEFKSSPNIEGYMFMECKNLLTVTVPTACKNIELNAFYGGTDNDGISLTTINLNEDLEVIAGYAFEKNENLGQVKLPSKLKQIGYNAFCDCHAMTLGNDNGQLPNSITDIDNQAFANTSIAKVILPANDAYTTVKTNVFGWSRELTEVTIPANVKTLMDGSFRDSKKLAVINDDAATITEIGDEAFMNDIALPSAQVNQLIAHLTTLNNGVFNGCTAVTEVKIPASVKTLKNLTFANCTNINRVTVNSATAPTGYAVNEGVMRSLEAIPNTNPVEYRLGPSSDPFAAVNANHMTLTFANDAVDGYKSYRGGSEATVENNPFRRLLTKTLDETATKYDVAGQMHADVVLKRTMVEGWNTVALPFGVKADSNRDRDYTAAGVYKAAFNGTDAADDKFMIAAYRGIDNDVFKFLKYANYEEDPLDEFEPLLIRMGSGNISLSNEYTFEDVDLNYDVEENKLYRDGNTDEEVPVKRWVKAGTWEAFIGNYNRDGADAIAPFVNCKDDYAFMGTYTTKTTSDRKKEDGTITYEGGTPYAYTNLPSGYFLTAEDDYIIQGNKFYKVVGTKSYGLRGYRAWFQKQPTTGTARPAQLMFSVVELDGDTPTEIDSFDAVDSDVKPFDVYSIGGQLLRKQTKSLNGLPNGIYIVNGRKVAVGK